MGASARMPVSERESLFASLEREILKVLGSAKKPVPIPTLIDKVATEQKCSTEDVAISLGRLSGYVRRVSNGAGPAVEMP